MSGTRCSDRLNNNYSKRNNNFAYYKVSDAVNAITGVYYVSNIYFSGSAEEGGKGLAVLLPLRVLGGRREHDVT